MQMLKMDITKYFKPFIIGKNDNGTNFHIIESADCTYFELFTIVKGIETTRRCATLIDALAQAENI